MTYADIIETIQENGDSRAIERLKTLNVDFKDRYYGWNLTQIAALSRQVKKYFVPSDQIADIHELALKLWESGSLDAKMLAVHIDDPKKVTEEQVDEWVRGLSYAYIVNKFTAFLVSKQPYAMKKMYEWIETDDEMVQRAGWAIVIGLANSSNLPDKVFEELLQKIEDRIQNAYNWAKELMNWAIIEIGARNEHLNELALDATKRIGTVVVDYGDTSCTTPNAMGMLTSKRVKDKIKLKKRLSGD